MNRPAYEPEVVAAQHARLMHGVGGEILASKGILAVPSANVDPRPGAWIMEREGWRQHGTGEFRPYDQRLPFAPEGEQERHPMWRVAEIAAGLAILMLLWVVAGEPGL